LHEPPAVHVGTREDGWISRCMTSYRGIPAVTCQDAPSLSPRRTPKSVDAYSVWVASSRTMSLTGRSPSEFGVGKADEPLSTSRFVNTPAPAAPVFVTLKTWPGVVGVTALYPEYEIHAWFTLFGSTVIPLGNRVGDAPDAELSIRSQVTFAGSLASALWVTKMRPAEVAAQIVPWSALSRAIHEIEPPLRSPTGPYTVPVRSPDWLMHDGIGSGAGGAGTIASQYGPPSGL